ncbi:ATP-binding protein [Streptomyces sp. V4-01]|uniref:ATP-binding protein n=1 Tax=Actinacidiphila polyblastidii TaxID=3110430 RepID=A0ABU7P743_9ACTN|nr:ATP-binding protein [Streptomyces sp. V4-01]
MQLRQASVDERAVIRRWGRDRRNVATARGVLLKALTEWGLEEIADSAVLVLSELLTNAVRHAHVPAGREIETRFRLTGDRVRIEVHDSSDEKPVRGMADVDSLDGRGLWLVDTLSGSWGVTARDGVGKVVWAEFRLPGTGGDDRGA